MKHEFILQYWKDTIDWDDLSDSSELIIRKIDKSEFFKIKNISTEYVLKHLKQSIGILTPRGKSKFIPAIKVGNFEISVQISYNLWSHRLLEDRDDDNSPMSRYEFESIMLDSRYDVRVKYSDEVILPPTLMSVDVLCDELQRMVIKIIKE